MKTVPPFFAQLNAEPLLSCYLTPFSLYEPASLTVSSCGLLVVFDPLPLSVNSMQPYSDPFYIYIMLITLIITPLLPLSDLFSLFMWAPPSGF